MSVDVEFFHVIVTPVPTDADHAPLLEDPAAVRIVRAGEVAEGDLILAAFEPLPHRLARTNYFNDQYGAHPAPYDPTCPCGVCVQLVDEHGPVVVLSYDYPWDVCDPWPTNAPVLVIPAEAVRRA